MTAAGGARLGSTRTAALLAAVLGCSYTALLAGVLADVLALVVVGGTGALVLELVLHRRLSGRLTSQVDVLRGELAARVLLVQLLVLAHVLISGDLPPRSDVVLVAAVVAHQALRFASRGLQLVDERLRSRRAAVRNLPGPAGPLPGRSPLLGEPGVLAVSGLAVLLPLALAVPMITKSYAVVLPAAAAMVVGGVVLVLASAQHVLPLLRRPRGDLLVRSAHEAVLSHAPEVIVYMSEGPQDLHCITGWLSTLEALDRPVLIMLRELATLDGLPDTSVPAVCLPRPQDVRTFRLPSAGVALFVAHSPGNLELVRDPGLATAHIGHGDSDKAASRSPVNQLYDELWVAGPAAQRRKASATVRAVPIRIVGRPQVRRVRARGEVVPGAPVRVLYAPTWEGLYGDPYESSLVHSGVAVVQELLAQPGVTVVYRPHPKTGFRDPAFARAHARILELLAAAGPEHRTSAAQEVDLYTCFNEVDLMVADVSAVVTDFLASDKPYFVVDGRGLPEEEFRQRVPSAAGAYLVGPGATGLAAGLADARGPDTLRSRRQQVRADLLGPVGVDPLVLFGRGIDALTDALAVAATRRSDAAFPSPTTSLAEQ